MNTIKVVLSSFGLSSIHFHNYIENSQYECVLLTDSRYKDSITPFVRKYRDVIFFDDFDSNALVDEFIFSLYQKFHITRLISIYEPDIIRAATIREEIKISGDKLKNILPFRDKVKMKDIASAGGCLTPKYSPINSPAKYLSFIRTQSYPVFIKPISSCGSVGARSINNQQESIEFLKSISRTERFTQIDNNLQVEEFIDGEFHHVDGLAIDGEILAKRIGKYSSNADLDTIRSKGFWSTVSLDLNTNKFHLIDEYIKKLIRVFSIYKKTFYFHCEIFIKNNQVYLCEIACRAPGGGMALAWEHAFGVSPFELCLEIELTGSVSDIHKSTIKKNLMNMTSFGSICILPLVGKYISSPTRCEHESVVSYKTMLTKNYKYGGCQYSGDTDCVITLKGRNEIELTESITDILRWYRSESQWELDSSLA